MPPSANLAERATELLVLAEDLARDLRDYADSVESDEQRLADIEDRSALIQSLKRKYGTYRSARSSTLAEQASERTRDS